MKTELACRVHVENPGFPDVTRIVLQLVGFLRDQAAGDPRFLSEFELAAAEALNNAVEHGCAAGGGSFFSADLTLRTAGVTLRVMDPSAFSGRAGEAALPEDPLEEGGRGFFLMSQMCDAVRHETDAGRHVLVLEKSFRSVGWKYDPGATERTLAEMTDELVASYEMISTLVGLGEWLATAPDMAAFMDGALRRLCEVTGAETAFVRFEKDGQLTLAAQSGPTHRPPVSSLPATGRGVEADVFRTGREITLTPEAALPADEPLGLCFHSGFVTPVLFKERRLGVLSLGRTVPAPFFNAGKLKVARTLAEFLGINVTLGELQKRRAGEERALRDLEIAAQIQLSLMPNQFSQFRGLDLYGTCRPALQAGGDYFDVLERPDGAVLCLIADVMGKGLSAALLAAMLRTNLHALVESGEDDPAMILRRANRLMCRDLAHLDMFITLVCARISPDRGELRLSSAGHHAGLLLRGRAGDAPCELDGGGLPLGISTDAVYDVSIARLDRGDRLLLYTDGIVEASSREGTMFGPERLLQSLGSHDNRSCRATVETLLAELDAFTGKAAPSDDRTVLLVARTA